MADQKGGSVGYGSPPKHSQFQPGESGNPAGRPKGSRNVKNVLLEVMSEKITMRENGREIVVSKQEALIRTLYVEAINGDKQAARILMNIWARYSRLFVI